MYRKSILLVVCALIIAGLVGSGDRIWSALTNSGLPSSYDPGITVMDAMQTAEHPLLIEFYRDDCSACRRVTPWVAELKEKYKDRLHFVMVDVMDPAQSQVSDLFTVQFVPALYVFDTKHMAKAMVDDRSYGSKAALDAAIERAIQAADKKAKAKMKGA